VKTQVGLPVLMRRFAAGDVIAMLPTLPGNTLVACCMSMHEDGTQEAVHITATLHQTVNATTEEYADLLPKLRALYPENDFIVYERDQPYWFTRMRVQHLEWVREAIPDLPVITLESIAKNLQA
jgi:hypothetical protein